MPSPRTKRDWYDFYSDQGLRPIPVFPGSKIPVGRRWNRPWDRSRSRRQVAESSNLGVLLGDVVDVEADTPEANARLCSLIGDCRHPAYRSQRSTHHLFLNPDPSLTATTFGGIEFRGHRHHSLVPPSVCGGSYEWLPESTFPVPQMPARLLNFYFQNRRRTHKKVLPRGLVRSECRVCKGSETIHKRRLKLEVQAFAEYRLPWMCRECREFDFRDRCRELKRELFGNKRLAV